MDNPDEPVGDETRAFQQFYLGDEEPPRRGLLYRVFVGWWRRPR
ncbi:MAG: hypothetical protein ACYDEN_08150 [Acidimicrobiales bacterium]